MTRPRCAHLPAVDLGEKPAPDEATVCKFRHLREEHDLGKRVFEEMGRHLQGQGMKVSNGTIIDATIINAPSSTKNASGERDPQMHQTKKCNQWYFGRRRTSSFIRWQRPRPTCTTAICCLNCFTDRKGGCGATAPTPDKPR